MFGLLWHHPIVLVLDFFDATFAPSGNPVLCDFVENQTRASLSWSHTSLFSEFLPFSFGLVDGAGLFAREYLDAIWHANCELALRVFKDFTIRSMQSFL